jgi:hypothetical protein
LSDLRASLALLRAIFSMRFASAAVMRRV